MFHIAPMANNDDGKLELMIADPVSRRRILTLLPKLMSGKHVDEAEIQHQSLHSSHRDRRGTACVAPRR